MKTTTKNNKLLLLVPLLTMMIATSFIGVAYAQNTSTTGPKPSITNQYGKTTQGVVCGDKLCNEMDTTVAKVKMVASKPIPNNFPSIKTIESFKFDPSSAPHAYIDVLKVTGGDANVENVKILVSSDIDTIHTDIDGLFANQDTTLVTRINAIDPVTIIAQITSYQLDD